MLFVWVPLLCGPPYGDTVNIVPVGSFVLQNRRRRAGPPHVHCVHGCADTSCLFDTVLQLRHSNEKPYKCWWTGCEYATIDGNTMFNFVTIAVCASLVALLCAGASAAVHTRGLYRSYTPYFIRHLVMCRGWQRLIFVATSARVTVAVNTAKSRQDQARA